jgi:hypothetical protein
MDGRVGMSKNSWLMLRKYGLPLNPTSGRGMIDHPRILRRLSNVTRREPGSEQQARVSRTRGNESQMRNMLGEKMTTFACDVESLVTTHQPVQLTLQLRKLGLDNQERLHRHSLLLCGTPYGRTLESISDNETGFNQ